jgi:hypothetical protein
MAMALVTIRTMKNSELKQAVNSKSKLCVLYIASTKLMFLDYLETFCRERSIRYYFVEVGHHPTWFTKKRKWFKNFGYILKKFLYFIIGSWGGDICVFGTWGCRILFPLGFIFKNKYFIFNEMPECNPKRLIFYYDKLIFSLCKNISLSSRARAEHIQQTYKLKFCPEVVENISIGSDLFINSKEFKILFSGTINFKRFNLKDIDAFKDIYSWVGVPISVYGKNTGDISAAYSGILDFKGEVTHAGMQVILRKYEYSILSYYLDDINNDFCAPLKVFEYLSAGCKIISINKNKGLLDLNRIYPGLIIFWDKNSIEFIKSFDENNFNYQRKRFLMDAEANNRIFSEKIILNM